MPRLHDDDRPVVVVKGGAFQVDLAQLCEIAGGAATRTATPDEVRDATGEAIGGVSSVAWSSPLTVLVDVSVKRFSQILAACGAKRGVRDELVSLTGGVPIEF